MSSYSPERLIALWSQEKIDEKMAIGHILQHLAQQQKVQAATNVTVYQFQDKLDTFKTELANLKQAVDRLMALIEMLVPNQSKGNQDDPS